MFTFLTISGVIFWLIVAVLIGGVIYNVFNDAKID
jgi:hypothetical protein